MPTNYNATPPPNGNYRAWLYEELRRIDAFSQGTVTILAALEDKAIVVGAVDSGGVGFRMLTIPN